MGIGFLLFWVRKEKRAILRVLDVDITSSFLDGLSLHLACSKFM